MLVVEFNNTSITVPAIRELGSEFDVNYYKSTKNSHGN